MFDEFTQIHKKLLDNMNNFLELQKVIFEDYKEWQGKTEKQYAEIRDYHDKHKHRIEA